MTKKPSMKLSEVFVLITPQVIRIHWEVVVAVVAVAVVVCRLRRGVKILKYIDFLVNYPASLGLIGLRRHKRTKSSREEIQVSRQYRGVQHFLEESVKTTYTLVRSLRPNIYLLG